MGKIVYNGREYLSAGTASTMQGATSTTDGISGLVPQPLIADRDKILKGDGTWGDASEVEANPSGTATDTLQTIDINGTIYDIQGGGGGGSNGGAAYTETVLWNNPTSTASWSNPVIMTLNDNITNYHELKVIFSNQSGDTYGYVSIPVSEVLAHNYTQYFSNDAFGGASNYVIVDAINEIKGYPKETGTPTNYVKVIGIKYGGNLSPIIYSTEEREVGVWIDNKPLYQKTYLFNALTNVPSGRWFDTGFTATDISIVGEAYGFYQDASAGVPVPILASCDSGTNQPLNIYLARNVSTEMHGFTIQYTKTTDVAGSGSYNTLGVPNVHYDDNEQIIGTWFGKPIYRIVLHNNGATMPQDTDVSTLNIETLINSNAIGSDNNNYTVPKWSLNSVSGSNGRLLYLRNANTIRREGNFNVYYIIIEYTKTTD